MLNVRRIMGQMATQVNRKAPKVSPSVVKTATKSEQATVDYFQKASTHQVPIFFNRATKRLFDKLKIQ